MSAHELVLLLHSYLRWLLLGLGAALVVHTFGRRGGGDWSVKSERLQKAFLATLDTQLVLGILLYVGLSPISRAFFASPGPSMKVTELRFFGIEHVTMMVTGVIVAHVGRARTKRAADDRSRHRRAFGWTLASVVVMLTSVPWPFMPVKRPLVRAPSRDAQRTADPPAAPCPPVYAARCASCHGDLGRGDGPLAGGLEPSPRSFADGTWTRSVTDDHIRSVVRQGGAAHGLSPLMPPHPDLTDGEVDGLVRCVRGLAGAP